MKIVMFLSKPFITDPRVYKEAKSLSEANHEVTIIFWDRHTEYKSDEMIENIRTIGIRNAKVMKLLPHVLLRNPFWCMKAYTRAMRLYKKECPFDAVHCHDLDTLLIGYLLKKKLPVKLIYDSHEIFGYMAEKTLPKKIASLAFLYEKILLKNIDHLITVNDPLKKFFSEKTKKPIDIVMNCANLSLTEYIPPKPGIFTVSYFGVLDKSRMFPEILDYLGSIHDIRFVIGGREENLYAVVKQESKKYNNIMFLGTISSKQVIERTFDCNAVLCIMDPANKNNQVGLPNKIFEAMSVGRPVIITRGLYCSELVEREKCGIPIEYSHTGVTSAVKLLRDNRDLCEKLGKNGLNVAIHKYNWKEQENVLLAIYDSLNK